MRHFLLFLCLSLSLCSPAPVSAQETPTGENGEFVSHITLNQNTSITIKETIRYYTPAAKHGIYRYIPLQYNRGDKLYTTSVSNVSVSLDNGDSHPFTQSRENRNLVLKIGDPDRTFTGYRTYIVSYTVSDALTRFADHDELYWDITGEGWQFPLISTKASFSSPFAAVSQIRCYAGVIGADDGQCRTNLNPAQITYDVPVVYGNNVTVALWLDQPNQLLFPTSTQRLAKSVWDNLPFLFIPLPLIVMFLVWYRWGRDYEFLSPNIFDMDPDKPKRLKPLFSPSRTPFVYEPLKSLTPGEAGALLDEKIDNRDIVADIIDLARRKLLKIEASEKKGFLSTSTEYTFTKLKDSPPDLPAHVNTLFSALFAGGDVTTLSQLKGTFYTTMASVGKHIDTQLTKNKLYVQNPESSRGIGLTLAIIINILAGIIVFPAAAFLGVAWPYVLFLMQAAVGLILGYNLTQKSAVGTNLMLQAKGLKQTITLGKWREEIKEKHLFIEEILPFAIALGVIDKLARDMKDLGVEPPQYLANAGFTGGNWSGMITGFTAHAATTLSYNPSSKGWSGGSGFSGGSSGGGGGGGGGGSW